MEKNLCTLCPQYGQYNITCSVQNRPPVLQRFVVSQVHFIYRKGRKIRKSAHIQPAPLHTHLVITGVDLTKHKFFRRMLHFFKPRPASWWACLHQMAWLSAYNFVIVKILKKNTRFWLHFLLSLCRAANYVLFQVSEQHGDLCRTPILSGLILALS